ncbi:MAG: metallophosphoesterase [Porcipelethomonas sp.]
MRILVFITGDIHGETEPIYNLCQSFQPESDDIVVILGDTGLNYTGRLRDRIIKEELSGLKPTFFCIHGNHENRPQNIASYKEKEWHGGRVLYEDDFPNILFPVDGDIFEIEGKRCIVIGGAYSVDKFYRISNGWNWWHDEQPTPEIKDYVENQLKVNKVDVVFSHTCPYKYIPTECFLPRIDQSSVDNSTEKWLDKIEEMIDYKAWYMGHWHIDKRIDKMHFLFHGVEIV